MLVLVLILVVIALVLLLAGWFLHLVVLAWTSVGISVLAGLVLLYDWWQTRSAVRAGRQGSGPRDGDGDRPVPPGTGQQTSLVGAGGGPDGFGGADMEPATQVLPIVPPPSNAAEETVVMPVVAPSGSADAPSGASRSGGLSSRSVTDATADEPSAPRSADGETTAVDPAAGPEPGGGGDPSGTAAPDASRPDRAREVGSGGTGARTPDAEQATTAAPAGGDPAGATRAVPASDAAGSAGSAGATGAAAVGGAAVAGGAVAGGAVAGGAAAVAGGAGGSTSGQPDGRPADATTRAEQAPAGGAGPVADDPTSVAAVGGAPGAAGAPPADDRTRAAAIDTSGEAPEEPRDPAHASLVARLPDEVVVIDEHPRYHVQGCPSLPGQAVIPLPVSEAVELGFTPCGWCSPNRVLSERHPAEAR